MLRMGHDVITNFQSVFSNIKNHQVKQGFMAMLEA